MLRDLTLKGVYKSDEDNILSDFYIPALSEAVQYDRAVGFFSASTISCAAQGLSVFIKNNGHIRLLLGAFSDKEDIEAVKSGYNTKAIIEKIGTEFLEIVDGVSDELFQNRFEALAWLVAHGRLDIKIALREKGMYHDKIGIITDEVDGKLIFSGSANESTHALLPTFNYESINVFPNWKPELENYFAPHIASFERLWNNKSSGTVVLDIPTAIKERLLSITGNLNYTPDPDIELAIGNRIRKKLVANTLPTSSKPTSPNTINGQKFEMRPHQTEALQAWKTKGEFQGILELATGAGKTITALYGMTKLAEAIDGLTCVIAVPYQNLADQWVDILGVFNAYPVQCYHSKNIWLDKLKTVVHETVIGSRKFTAIVVVNRTLKSSEFQEELSKLRDDKLLWIGDECHHHNSVAYEGYLPKHAKYRIGLSATPEHYIDETKNDRLKEYYGPIVAKYTLKEAIEDKVLTPYNYFPHVVEFTNDEAEEFLELSEQIGKLFARGAGIGSNDDKSTTQLTALLMKRARLMGSASNKLKSLMELMKKSSISKHTLFYCGDGSVEDEDLVTDNSVDGQTSVRQIEAVSKILYKHGWNLSRFTSRESRKERTNILESFRIGLIDAMVAIKCLDEGIDIPACGTAYILASSRDPRQFVQRRGRILRKSPGKDTATIHDFIVILPEEYIDGSEDGKKLVKSELQRVAEFSTLSLNRHESYNVLKPILKLYDLEHLI